MKRTLLYVMIAILSGITFTAQAEVLTLGNTEPAAGIIEKFGSLRVYNQAVPVPNPECKTPAQLYINDVLVDAIESTSSRVQRFIMQPDECFTLYFTSKPYTTSGTYRVTIPEGFVTYKDSENINAATTYEFTILPEVKIVAEPATGFVSEMPRHVTLTFEGLSEVIDLEKKGNSQGDGAIRFDNPEGFCYPEITIEGNVMHLYFGPNEEAPEDAEVPEEAPARAKRVIESDEYMTWLGSYTLTFNKDNLTYVYPDGTRRNNYLTILEWVNPKLAPPTATPTPGVVKEISEINITLPEDGTYAMWNSMGYPRLYKVDENGTEKEVARFTLSNSPIKGESTATFVLSKPVTEPGQYIVRINKSSYSMNGETMSGWNDCKYDFAYEIEEAPEATKIILGSVNPMPDTVISQFNYTRLILSEPETIASVEATGTINYQVEAFGPDAAVTPGYDLEVSLNKSGEILLQLPTDVCYDLMDAGKWPITDPGRYVITIPEGALTVTSESGEVYTNDLITLSYNLLAPVRCDATPAADTKVAEFDNITLKFPEYGSMVLNEEFEATLKNSNGVIIPLGEPTVIESVLILPVADGVCSEPGEYTFSLGVGSVTFQANEQRGEQINPYISYTFECVGNQSVEVKSISPEQGVVQLLAGVTVTYTMAPRVNRECTELFKVYRNDEQVYEMPNTSGRVQFAIENDDRNLVTYTFGGSTKDFLREPGLYRIEIPEGFMMFGEGDFVFYSEALSLEYVIQEKPVYSVSPLPGSIESLSEVTLTFLNVKEIINNDLQPDDQGDGAIVLFSNSIEPDYPTVTVDGNKVTMTFAETYTYRENYMLDIPFGAFTLITESDNRIEFTGATITYSINKFPAPTADPAPGEYEDLGPVTLTLSEGMTFAAWYSEAELRTVSATGELGTVIGKWARDYNQSVKGLTAVTLSPKAEYTLEPGQYALVMQKSTFMVDVPEGSPYESGFNNTKLIYAYTIIPSHATDMTPEYENGYKFANELASFEIYFDEAESVELVENYARPNVVDAEGNTVDTNITLSYIDERAGLLVTLTPAIETEGTYTITIPAGVVLLNGKANPEYLLQYEVADNSGASLTDAESAPVTVYSIDGRIVLRDADASAISNLSRGLYIINGKKVMK